MAKAKAARVLFTRAYAVNAADGRAYEAGELATVNSARSVAHFVKRGVAVDATGLTATAVTNLRAELGLADPDAETPVDDGGEGGAEGGEGGAE